MIGDALSNGAVKTTTAPEARTTLQMSERENANLVGADAAHKLIGETRDEHSMGIQRSEARAGLRGLQELSAQSRPLPFIPLNGGSGVDGLDSATNFLFPSQFGVRVGAFIRAEAQGVGKHGFGCCRERRVLSTG